MKAIQIHEPGDVSQLPISDLLISDPNANEVQVRVSYAGVNFMDIGTRNGQLKRMMPLFPELKAQGSSRIWASHSGAQWRTIVRGALPG